jgi:hypothetical protein
MTSHTTTRYWVSRTVEGLDDEAGRGEVTLYGPGPGENGPISAVVTGGGFRPEGLSAAESVVFLGNVPAAPTTEEGVVAATKPGKPGEIITTRVYIRADNVPQEPK